MVCSFQTFVEHTMGESFPRFFVRPGIRCAACLAFIFSILSPIFIYLHLILRFPPTVSCLNHKKNICPNPNATLQWLACVPLGVQLIALLLCSCNLLKVPESSSAKKLAAVVVDFFALFGVGLAMFLVSQYDGQNIDVWVVMFNLSCAFYFLFISILIHPTSSNFVTPIGFVEIAFTLNFLVKDRRWIWGSIVVFFGLYILLFRSYYSTACSYIVEDPKSIHLCCCCSCCKNKKKEEMEVEQPPIGGTLPTSQGTPTSQPQTSATTQRNETSSEIIEV